MQPLLIGPCPTLRQRGWCDSSPPLLFLRCQTWPNRPASTVAGRPLVLVGKLWGLSGWHGTGLECDMNVAAPSAPRSIGERDHFVFSRRRVDRVEEAVRAKPLGVLLSAPASYSRHLLPGSLLSYFGLYSMESGGNPLTKSILPPICRSSLPGSPCTAARGTTAA